VRRVRREEQRVGTEETTPEYCETRPWEIGARARSISRNQEHAKSGTAWLGARPTGELEGARLRGDQGAIHRTSKEPRQGGRRAGEDGRAPS
jgi:hypothetical protein